jgi:hypothetical protein
VTNETNEKGSSAKTLAEVQNCFTTKDTKKFIRSPVFTLASCKETPPVLALPYATLSFAFFARDTSFSARLFVALTQDAKVAKGETRGCGKTRARQVR